MNYTWPSVLHVDQTQQYCLHSLLEVHKCHIDCFRATVKFSVRKGLWFPEQKLPLPHYITRCWWKLNIGEYLLLITLHYHLVVLLMLQHLSKSKEVFLPAAVLHRPRWHKGRGAQVARARAPAQCSVHHQSCFLQHWDTAVQTNTATQRWQIPSCSKLYWKLRALKHPYPWATKHPSY